MRELTRMGMERMGKERGGRGEINRERQRII